MSDDIQWDVGIQTMDLTPLELEAAAGLLQMRRDADVNIGQREALFNIIKGINERGENQLSPEQKKTTDDIYRKLLASKKVKGGKRKTRKHRRKSRKKKRKRKRKGGNKPWKMSTAAANMAAVARSTRDKGMEAIDNLKNSRCYQQCSGAVTEAMERQREKAANYLERREARLEAMDHGDFGSYLGHRTGMGGGSKSRKKTKKRRRKSRKKTKKKRRYKHTGGNKCKCCKCCKKRKPKKKSRKRR